MSIETGIRSALIADNDVQALVSGRVYPLYLPQGFSLSAITYQRISSERTQELGAGSNGRVWSRFQVDCWAESYSGVRDLADKVRLVLDGHRGTLGSETKVGSIRLLGEHDLFEDDAEVFRVLLEFSIPYFETV